MELKEDSTPTVEIPVPVIVQDTQEVLEQFAEFVSEDYRTYKRKG